MKIVFMIESDTIGIYDVFNTVTIPFEVAPPGLIDRWRSIINVCPIEPLIVIGKENLAIGSTWDPELETFTLADDMPLEYAKPLTQKNAVFLINNVVIGMVGITAQSPIKELFEAAYSSLVTIVEVEDNSEVSPGYTWDGTNFYPPLT